MKAKGRTQDLEDLLALLPFLPPQAREDVRGGGVKLVGRLLAVGDDTGMKGEKTRRLAALLRLVAALGLGSTKEEDRAEAGTWAGACVERYPDGAVLGALGAVWAAYGCVLFSLLYPSPFLFLFLYD